MRIFVRVQFAVAVNNKTCCSRMAIPFGCQCHKHPYILYSIPIFMILYLSHFEKLFLIVVVAAFQSALRRLQRVNFIQIKAAGRTDADEYAPHVYLRCTFSIFQYTAACAPLCWSNIYSAEWDARTMHLSAFHQKRNLISLLQIAISLARQRACEKIISQRAPTQIWVSENYSGAAVITHLTAFI